uniref:Uncharacterized protein n=1 Tax=Candidozyma auris TaxID=498019 RepID=A0A0L0P4E8_CANAR
MHAYRDQQAAHAAARAAHGTIPAAAHLAPMRACTQAMERRHIDAKFSILFLRVLH